MKSLLIVVCAFCILASLCRAARARALEAAPTPPPERVQPLNLRALPEGPTGEVTVKAPSLLSGDDHPTPRVKLSWLRHGIGDGSGGSFPLQALHLDLYPLSWKYLRAGVEVEAGRGRGKIDGRGSSVAYGLVGVNLGLQIPRRITPFIEGRIAGGIINTRFDGAVMIPGTPISVNGGGSSFIHTSGVDVGVEVYTFGRGYLSVALGYQRTTYQQADFDLQNNMISKSISHDSFLLKLGLGI